MMSRLHSVLKFTSHLLHKDADRAGPPPPPPPKDTSVIRSAPTKTSSVIQTQSKTPRTSRTDDACHGVLFLRAGLAPEGLSALPQYSHALPSLPKERRPHSSDHIAAAGQQDNSLRQHTPKRRFIFDEEERKRALEEDLRLAGELRRQREERERYEEQEMKRIIEERRLKAKQRRLEHGRAAQEWRIQQLRQLQDSAQREKESRERIRENRRVRSISSDASFADSMFSGWVSAQSAGSPIWRRRYCRIQANSMKLYNDSVGRILTFEINLDRVMNLKDTNDDFEELESLPNAFAIQVQDDTNYAFICDNSESKELLVSLITQIAGL